MSDPSSTASVPRSPEQALRPARLAHAFGDIEVDPAERRLRVRGRPINVGARAFDLLVALTDRAGALVSKDELMDAVWGRTVVEEANLHVHVSALRKVLGPSAIATVPGRGYRFMPPAGSTAVPALAAPVQARPTDAPPLPIFGREDDIAALDEWLVRHRLVTITGAGGIGKTRLAGAAAWRWRERYAEGSVTVELASLADPALIPGAIAAALKVPIGPAGDALTALVAAVQPLDLLLVLDNAEHLVAAVARVAETLIRAAPSLHLIVTSQAPLRVEHERVFRLGGLDVPDGGREISAVDALGHGAVALFNERLQAAHPHLRVDDDNVGDVLTICRRLDGIALAIELAAARCPLFGIRGIAERLDECLRLLRVDSRSAPSRQQTLAATLAWSHSLLSPAQQSAFRQLGVFVGTFTLDMAISLLRVDGHDEAGCIDLLAELVDRSLVQVDGGDPPRYRLLETGRLFALAQLNESGEVPTLRLRHLDTMRAHFETAAVGAWTLAEAVFVHRYEADLDNLRAALDEAQARVPEAAVAMAGAAARLWRLLSLHPEAVRRCQAAADCLTADTPPALEARLWEGMAQVCGELSHAIGRPAAQRAADLYRRLGDRRGLFLALAHLAFSYSGEGVAAPAHAAHAEMQGLEDPAWPPSVRLFGRKVTANLALGAGDIEGARVATNDRLELATTCGSQRDANAALGNLADLALIKGDAAEAVRLGRAVLARLRRRDAATRAVSLSNLLHALLVAHADDDARVAAAETVAAVRQINFMFLMYAGDAFALLAARERRWPAAGALLGYSDAAYAAQGQTRELNEAHAHAEATALLAAHCVAADIQAWTRDGARLEPAAVCALALALPANPERHDSRG